MRLPQTANLSLNFTKPHVFSLSSGTLVCFAQQRTADAVLSKRNEKLFEALAGSRIRRCAFVDFLFCDVLAGITLRQQLARFFVLCGYGIVLKLEQRSHTVAA
jgi:hypothetical protein